MADKTKEIDGDISLDAIRKRCQTEQGVIYQLTSIKGKSETVGNKVLLINVTEFDLKDDGVLRKLTFDDVKDKSAAEIKEIKKKRKDEGQTLLCDVSEIFASKNATKVLVFGKN